MYLLANAGRHPLLGIVVAFAAEASVSRAICYRATETGARLIQPGWTMNPLGNWWFAVAIGVLFTAVAWIVTGRTVAPRLGPWRRHEAAAGN